MGKRGQSARFIAPMECLPVGKIPEGALWTYELKLDGYRLVAVRTGGKVTLYSRRGTDLSNRFGYVTSALGRLPDETVVDGELVALDEQGKPNFNLLQNFRSAESHIMFYAFDVVVRRGEDLMKQALSKRREVLASTVETTRACWHIPSLKSDRIRDARLREAPWLGRDHCKASRQCV